MDCRQYMEIISAHVDGDLSSGEKLAVQSHLDECSRCTRMFRWETRARMAIRAKLAYIPARPALKQRVLHQMGENVRVRFLGWPYLAHGLTAAIALVLVVAVPYLFWADKAEEDIFTGAIAQYQKVRQGIENTPETGFPAARLLDLSHLGYRVLSRQSQRVKGQEGQIFIYEGPEKEFLLAQEVIGVEFSQPSSGTFIQTSSRNFVSYSQQGVNLIAWKQKDVLCILASALPREKLLSLAQQIPMGN